MRYLCFRCGESPEGSAVYQPTLTCPNCYDGAPDSETRHDIATARTWGQCIEQWNEMQEQLAEESEP